MSNNVQEQTSFHPYTLNSQNEVVCAATDMNTLASAKLKSSCTWY